MKNIITIFKKELIDITRDRRTITVMLLLPLVIYPLIFIGFSKYISSQTEKAAEKTLRIGIIENGWENNFKQFISVVPNTKIISLTDSVSAKALIEIDSIDAAYFFPVGYDSALAKLEAPSFNYYYTSTNNEFEVALVEAINQQYISMLTKNTLEEMQLSENILQPVKSNSINLASEREQLGNILGGLLPYFFIIFCMVGCMYPAIDLAAGEKERGSLETLLVSSASRVEIYVGKLLTVTLSGFISAVAGIIGIVASAKIIGGNADMSGGGMGAITEVLNGLISPSAILMLLLLLLPLNIFFAAITLMLSIYAKSFKEAQSMITPLMIVIIFPAIAGMLPGIKLDYITALIPILNVSLGSKAIIAGTVEAGPFILTCFALFVYAAIALFMSVRFFNDEKNVVRG
ncbi:MAG: ABC transporter permease [Fimbriimonadaceae bacterium]|nr:ABC transporter permease [Chitinophagales bacterium]